MAAELIIAPEAQLDLDAAYSWYEDRRPGLGEEFLSCVDACIQKICRMSELYEKAHEEYRRALVRRFPYAIFYEYTAGIITVYSICWASVGEGLRFRSERLLELSNNSRPLLPLPIM